MQHNPMYCIVNGEVNTMKVRIVTLNICWFYRLRISRGNSKYSVNTLVYFSVS